MLGTFGKGLFVCSVEGLELGMDVIRHELFDYGGTLTKGQQGGG
jgi:hypothetical protein